MVVIATGGVPDLDWIEETEHVTSVWDVLSGTVPVGEQVLIYETPDPTVVDVTVLPLP